MATYSSTLAWNTPWTEEPGRLQSIGSQESDTTQQLNHYYRARSRIKIIHLYIFAETLYYKVLSTLSHIICKSLHILYIQNCLPVTDFLVFYYIGGHCGNSPSFSITNSTAVNIHVAYFFVNTSKYQQDIFLEELPGRSKGMWMYFCFNGYC